MRFRSADELFAAVRALIARLEADGEAGAAVELRSGFGALTGLTDGWALFLETIEQVRSAYAKRFSAQDRRTLDAIRSDVRREVYRR
jgi:hypothetical protein